MIINGGNDSETKDFLNTLSEPFYSLTEKDTGIYDAMNKGIELSKGEWIYFLGAGDKLSNNNILETIFSESTKNISLIAGSVKYVGKNKAFIYSKKKKIKNASWNYLMWLRNGLHHQATFYKKSLFLNENYSTNYRILSDYLFNLKLFKKSIKLKKVNMIVAICSSSGVSKKGNWNLYKEEIELKTSLSHYILKPLFYTIAFLKYLIRKV